MHQIHRIVYGMGIDAKIINKQEPYIISCFSFIWLLVGCMQALDCNIIIVLWGLQSAPLIIWTIRDIEPLKMHNMLVG